MKIRIVQLVVERDVDLNFRKIIREIQTALPGEWIIFPEAMLSGYYPQEELYTEGLDGELIDRYLREIEMVVRSQKCYCLVGSASLIDGAWRNSVFTFSYLQSRERHDKIELSRLDNKHFTRGSRVQSHNLDGIKYGTLACRELIFPHHWSNLKDENVQIIFHLNNAIQPHDILWKHMLITRAIENSIFVVSVNNAASPQKLASYVISPRGNILLETEPEKEVSVSITIDLQEVIRDLSLRDDY